MTLQRMHFAPIQLPVWLVVAGIVFQSAILVQAVVPESAEALPESRG